MKCFTINLIAKNEDLKEKIYKDLLNFNILNLKQELETLGGKYVADFEATFTNGDKGIVKIYTTMSQFSFRSSLISNSIKQVDSSYIAFELSEEKFWMK